MNYEIDKVMRIVDQLGAHLLKEYQAETLSVAVNRTREGYRIVMGCPVNPTDAEKIETLRKDLSQARKSELEDYYWQLSGDVADSNSLGMVSIMCDSITLDYRNGTLSIEMMRTKAR